MIHDTRDVDLLKETPLFAGYSRADLTGLLRFSKRTALDKGQHLFHKGESCSAFYLLRSGLIKLYCCNNKGQQKIVEIVDPGQTFAEAALFSGQGYPVDAMALEDSLLIAIEGFAFTRFLQRRPELAWKMLATLSRHLHQLVHQVESLTLLNAEQRVCAYLLEHSDLDAPACLVRHVPPRRAELASRLGITSETLCRVLSDLKRRDLIETADSKITITDYPGLQALIT